VLQVVERIVLPRGQAARDQFVDWEGEAQRTLAFFRAWWPHYAAYPALPERKELRHPHLGRLVFHPLVLQPNSVADQYLVVYAPRLEAETMATRALHAPHTCAPTNPAVTHAHSG
jgi:hypothetical protein